MPYQGNEITRKIRDHTIIQDRLSGMSYAKLSKKHKLAKMTLHSILNREESKTIIDTHINEMICLAPLAKNNLERYLQPDFEDIKVQWNATKTLLENLGIWASHTRNVYIDKLIMQQKNIVNNPVALRAVERYCTEDVIDIDLGLDGGSGQVNTD
jgi:lambda repressor-like predicted transcriptional regulator